MNTREIALRKARTMKSRGNAACFIGLGCIALIFVMHKLGHHPQHVEPLALLCSMSVIFVVWGIVANFYGSAIEVCVRLLEDERA